jgi:hypothetical protein
MNSSKKNPDSLARLRMEKYKLSTYCTYQEKLIGLKVDYLRENYPRILSDALLPYDRGQNAWVGNLLDSVNDLIISVLPDKFKGKRWSGLVMKLVEILMIRAIAPNKRSK